MARNRDDTGRYVASAALSEVLDVFEQVEGPVVTSGDVADALGYSRETARTKLGRLYDQGRVGQRKTAGRVVWWRLGGDDGLTTPTGMEPDDPLFSGGPIMSVDMGEGTIDDVLYGSIVTADSSDSDSPGTARET
jgi:alkylated DNA nucleotide flippase Atl1